ncbi:MAG: hypothetical protein IKC45_04295 [Clostridia bacterium]|nr:hypothetical protein [Clostridia bacterium]
MEEKQKNNIINSKTESLLKLVSGLLIISCAITVALLFKINEMNDNINRLTYIMNNETESYQHKDTIDVFYDETENGEEMLPVYDEYHGNKSDDTTNKQTETTSKIDNSIIITENKTNKNEETQSSNISTKKNYVINTNSNKIHYSSCSFVARMKEENKKEIELSKDELNNYLNNGYTFCRTCGG